MSRPSKKQKRIQKQQGIIDEGGNFNIKNFHIRNDIEPMTDTQKLAFESWDEGYNLMLHGVAGTGKTFLALYFALSQVLEKNSEYEKVYIIRSTVSSREQGFLPGNQKQKESVYEEPYYPIATSLFGRGDAYSILKQHQKIEFRSTSYLRGTTFDNCIIVVDEVQNMTDIELHTIMTRVGENSKIIFAGDIRQDDLTNERKKEYSGLQNFMRILSNMYQFDFIEFYVDDIVRSDLVKSYIIERHRLGL